MIPFQNTNLKRAFRKNAWIMLAPFLTCLFFLSQQLGDLSHSSGFVDGLIGEGLHFYETASSTGYGTNYTPGLYLLLGVAISPAILLKHLFGARVCNAEISPLSCLPESVSLKVSIILLAFASCWLCRPTIEKLNAPERLKTRQETLGLLGVPTVLYSWLLFGAYDGLGGLTAIVGPLLFLRRKEIATSHGLNEKFLLLAGLGVTSLSVSAKLFPLIIVLGVCIGFSRNSRDFTACLIIPSCLTIAQVTLAAKLGGAPLSIVSDKLVQGGPFLYSQAAATIAITGLVACIVTRYRKSSNRPAVGFLIATSIYAIGFPSFRWHPQWQLYYGVALFFAFRFLHVSGRLKRLFGGIIAIQALAFVVSTQWWASNADISMSLSLFNRHIIPSFYEFTTDSGLNSLYIIDKAWIIYSLSQLASLVLLMIALEKSYSRRIPDSATMTSSYQWPGMTAALFLVAWIAMNAVSIAATHDWALRANALIRNRPIEVGTNADNTYGDPNSQKTIALENNSVYTFTLGGKDEGPKLVKFGTVTIGNNFGQSKGTLRICLSSENYYNAVTNHNTNSHQCSSLDLSSTRDNRASWFSFTRSAKDNWEYLSIHAAIEKGSPNPVLYIKPDGRPYASLYGSP
jgi:hypothetical protein